MTMITLLREALKMTQEQFSEHCGVSRISIARYEAGKKISRANAEKIAAACHVPIDTVLRDLDSEEYKLKKESVQYLVTDTPLSIPVKPSELAKLSAIRNNSVIDQLTDQLMQLPPDLVPQLLDLLSLPPAQLQRVLDFASGLRAAGSE